MVEVVLAESRDKLHAVSRLNPSFAGFWREVLEENPGKGQSNQVAEAASSGTLRGLRTMPIKTKIL